MPLRTSSTRSSAELPEPSFGQVQKYFRRQGFPFYSRPFDLNLIMLRHPGRRAGIWQDRIGWAFYDEDTRPWLKLFEGTTVPGTYYLEAATQGVRSSIIVPGHYKQAYVRGPHGISRGVGYPALRQRGDKPMAYVRDLDGDHELDIEQLIEAGQVEWDYRATNVHRAERITISETLHRASAGCPVIRLPWDWAAFLCIADLQVEHGHGDVYSATLADWGDVLEAA